MIISSKESQNIYIYFAYPIRNPSDIIEMTCSIFFYSKVGLMNELLACTDGDSKMGQTHMTITGNTR
jgi:hypothetical protein